MLEADEFAGDFAVAVNDVRLRGHGGAVPLRDRRMIVPGGRIEVGWARNALVAEEFVVGWGIFMSSRTHNHAVSRLDVFFEAVEGRSVCPAGRATGRPDV